MAAIPFNARYGGREPIMIHQSSKCIKQLLTRHLRYEFPNMLSFPSIGLRSPGKMLPFAALLVSS